MTGKKQETFKLLYEAQMQFQKKVEHMPADFPLPIDDPSKFIYHMSALSEEMGEVLKADKRWKTHRNDAFNPEEKLDEIADCYITLFNISMWSGFPVDTILSAIQNKIVENNKRIGAI